MTKPMVLPDFAPEDVWECTSKEVQLVIEAGALKDAKHYELLGGRLIRKIAKGEKHILVHSLLMRALVMTFGREYAIRSEAPFSVSQTTEPEPDFLIVLPGVKLGPYQRPNGTQCVVGIEISDSSSSDDLGWKRDLYARGMLPEYWVIDVNLRRVYVHRHPNDGVYGGITIISENDELPRLNIRLADILP